MAIYIKADLQPFITQLQALGRDGAKAVARGMNRTIQSAQTLSVRAIAEDLGIAQKEVRKTMALRKANRTRLEASLTSTGRRIPLIAFRARGPEPSRGKGKGVRYRLPGGRGIAPHAFIATMKTGHRGVFQRKGPARRLPIAELRGPSVPRVFRKQIDDAIQAKADAALVKNVQHEIEYLLSKRTTPGGEE